MHTRIITQNSPPRRTVLLLVLSSTSTMNLGNCSVPGRYLGYLEKSPILPIYLAKHDVDGADDRDHIGDEAAYGEDF